MTPFTSSSPYGRVVRWPLWIARKGRRQKLSAFIACNLAQCRIEHVSAPRQLPSRHIRKRLEMLYEVFPPPKGYAVFPEELNGK